MMDRRRNRFYFAMLLLLMWHAPLIAQQPAPPAAPTQESAAKSDPEAASAQEKPDDGPTQRERWSKQLADFAVVAVPRVALIVVLLFVALYAVRVLGRRLISLWSHTARRTAEEGRNRAETLVGVFENAATTAIYAIGALTIFEALKVPVSTLLGGVAVAGLAVAFGAQNLIRDYFYGFMILLEDQYKINDVITVNNMTGKVENITLRITMLRDFEGKVYFIPNGQINSVINQTHEWSRVVIDVPVAYDQDIDKVTATLAELAQEMVADPNCKEAVLRNPEVIGVEKLTDKAAVLRVCLVTKPSQKDDVRREMLRRIKSRFDERGIKIPPV